MKSYLVLRELVSAIETLPHNVECLTGLHYCREELYRECVAALQGGQLLNGEDFKAVKKALQEAFESADAKLLKW